MLKKSNNYNTFNTESYGTNLIWYNSLLSSQKMSFQKIKIKLKLVTSISKVITLEEEACKEYADRKRKRKRLTNNHTL